jgi:hypothetical protein
MTSTVLPVARTISNKEGADYRIYADSKVFWGGKTAHAQESEDRSVFTIRANLAIRVVFSGRE